MESSQVDPIFKKFVFDGTPKELAILLDANARAHPFNYLGTPYRDYGDKAYVINSIPEIGWGAYDIPTRVVYLAHGVPVVDMEGPQYSFIGIDIELASLAGDRTDVKITCNHPVFADDLAALLRVMGQTADEGQASRPDSETSESLRNRIEEGIESIATGEGTIKDRVEKIDIFTMNVGGYTLPKDEMARRVGSTESTVKTYRRPRSDV